MKVQFETVSVPAPDVLAMAPPLLFVFESKTHSETLSWPVLVEIAPVTAALRVIPLIAAMSPELTVKILTALLPLTVSRPAPGPVIVSVSPVAGLIVMTLAKVIVCGVAKTIGSNPIVSEPPAVFESRTACRRLPVPLSFVLVTVKVAAEAPRALARKLKHARRTTMKGRKFRRLTVGCISAQAQKPGGKGHLFFCDEISSCDSLMNPLICCYVGVTFSAFAMN